MGSEMQGSRIDVQRSESQSPVRSATMTSQATHGQPPGTLPEQPRIQLIADQHHHHLRDA
jgi:hypothetical protein